MDPYLHIKYVLRVAVEQCAKCSTIFSYPSPVQSVMLTSLIYAPCQLASAVVLVASHFRGYNVEWKKLILI